MHHILQTGDIPNVYLVVHAKLVGRRIFLARVRLIWFACHVLLHTTRHYRETSSAVLVSLALTTLQALAILNVSLVVRVLRAGHRG